MIERQEKMQLQWRASTPRYLQSMALGACLTIATVAAIIASSFASNTDAHAKTPGKTYCFNRVCHRVLTLAETRRRVGRRTSLVASFYSHCRVDRFNPCGLTSSGARFRPSHADNAASPIYPNGTKLLVWNPSNKRAAVVRIDNAGPYWRNRKLDLSRAAATKLGFRNRGVARLIVQVLKAPTRRQARYRRYRKYAPVPGYIGRFASLASAARSAGAGAPAIVPGRRFAAANVPIPVRNTFLAERRIWLARMAEPRPVTVASAASPKIRLPVRLVRTALAPARSKRTLRRKLRVAALARKPKRLRRAKVRKSQPSRKSAKRLEAVATNKKKRRSANSPRVPTKKVSQRSKTIAQKPAKRSKAWRNGIFGIDPSEA